jgi:hypothetical protein
MKYVRLRNQVDEIVVLGLAPVSHADLAAVWQPRGYRPVSAGFLVIDPTRQAGCRTVGQSDSLNLGPGTHDARFIGMLYGATLLLALPGSDAAQPTDEGALGG